MIEKDASKAEPSLIRLCYKYKFKPQFGEPCDEWIYAIKVKCNEILGSYNKRWLKVCELVFLPLLFGRFHMRIGGSCSLCLTFYWEASPSQAMVEAKHPKVDPEVAAIEAAEEITDEIVIKICNNIYDKVMMDHKCLTNSLLWILECNIKYFGWLCYFFLCHV
jgi:hypothetical protein